MFDSEHKNRYWFVMEYYKGGWYITDVAYEFDTAYGLMWARMEESDVQCNTQPDSRISNST